MFEDNQECKASFDYVRDFLIGKLADKLIMLYKGVLFPGNLPTQGGRAVSGLLAVEEVAVIQFNMLYTLKSPYKVKVPVTTANSARAFFNASGRRKLPT